MFKNVVFQKVLKNLRKNNDFALQEGPKTSQDASKMAFGPLLGRSGSLLGRLGPLLAPLGSLLVRLEPLLAALGPLLAPLGSLLVALGPLWVRSRGGVPKSTGSDSNFLKAPLLSFCPNMGLVLLY